MKKTVIIILTAIFLMTDGAIASNVSATSPPVRERDVASGGGARANTPAQPNALSSAYFIGAYGSYNMRDAYRKLDGLDEYLPVDNADPFIYGGVLGRRRSSKNNPRLRSVTTMEIGYGSVKNTDLPFGVLLSDGSQTLANEYTRYITGGAIADWHYIFPSARQTVFLSGGIGLHLTSYMTQLRNTDNELLEASGYGGSHATFSPSVNVGIGVEQKLAPTRAIALAYNFRFWQSSRFIETGILFPMGVTYQEYFYSHSISVQILFPGLERGARFR